MTCTNVIPLTDTFEIKELAPYRLSNKTSVSVKKIWEREKSIQGDVLFNGKIYSLKKIEQNCLLIQPAEYCHIIARRRNPELANSGLDIRPLAVTGVIFCNGGVVLGKRSSSVSSDSGLWEPAPAGGMDTPDPTQVLMKELKKELGIVAKDVKTVKPYGLVEDIPSGVFDIVFRLDITLPYPHILKSYERYGTSEYSELKLVQEDDIINFLDNHRANLLPALESMLELTI